MDPCDYEYDDYDEDGYYVSTFPCDSDSIGYFDGYFYCEFHAKRLGKIK